MADRQITDARAAYLATTAEKDMQAGIVRRLRLLGFLVLEIGSTRRANRCPACGAMHRPTGWQGTTVGAPDLLVYIANRGLHLALEVKRPGGAIRPEQRELAALGATRIVRSQDEALAAVEEAMG